MENFIEPLNGAEKRNSVKNSFEEAASVEVNTFIVELQQEVVNMIKATITLGNYKSVEEFIVEAAKEKAEEYKKKFQAMERQSGYGRNRKK